MDFSDQNEVRRVVEGCVKGDHNCQKLLYKSLYSKMMGVCYRYCNRSADAKDLFQEGFIKVFEKIEKYNFKGSLEGWVRRIMVNNALDYYRKEKNKFAFSESSIEDDTIREEELDEGIFQVLSAEELLEMVQQLSPGYRAVFNLFVMEDYTHVEIAEILEISEGTSKSNLAKAKIKLKQMVLKSLKTKEY